MSLSLEQVWTYLNRIRFPLTDRLPRPDFSTLMLVHELHTRFVVFENMSLLVPSWQAIDVNPAGLKLDVPSLYQKIVTRGRGGYCFELNAAFAALLTGMGYSVRQGAARVVMDGMEVDPHGTQHLYLMTPFSHMVLFVSGGMLPQGNTYLCDTGLGGNTLTRPIEIVSKEVAQEAATSHEPPTSCTSGFAYRLRWGKCGSTALAVPADHDQGYYLQVFAKTVNAGSWHDLYYFTLATFGPMDFVSANYFTSTFPQSLFLKGPFCSRPDDKGGRYILMNSQLKYRDAEGVSQTQNLRSTSEVISALRSHFGIDVPPNELS